MKENGDVPLYHKYIHKYTKGEYRGITPLILNLGAEQVWVISAKLRLPLTTGKRGVCVGFMAGLNGCAPTGVQIPNCKACNESQ